MRSCRLRFPPRWCRAFCETGSGDDYIAYRQEDTKKYCYRMMRRVYRPGLAVWTVRSAAEAEKMKEISDAIIFESFRPEKM